MMKASVTFITLLPQEPFIDSVQSTSIKSPGFIGCLADCSTRLLSLLYKSGHKWGIGQQHFTTSGVQKSKSDLNTKKKGCKKGGKRPLRYLPTFFANIVRT